jgi:two-component system, probable response regulator PhcQ
MRRVLVVDDEVNVLSALRRLLQRTFQHERMQLELCLDPLQALARARYVAFDAVISDYRMPAMDGVTLLSLLRDIQPDAIRIILSASTDFDTIHAAINRADIFRYVVKPWSDDALVALLREGFARRDEALDNRRLADERRADQDRLSAEDQELRRLEALEPGITRVRWDTDGSILLEDL